MKSKRLGDLTPKQRSALVKAIQKTGEFKIVPFGKKIDYVVPWNASQVTQREPSHGYGDRGSGILTSMEQIAKIGVSGVYLERMPAEYTDQRHTKIEELYDICTRN